MRSGGGEGRRGGGEEERVRVSRMEIRDYYSDSNIM